MSIVHLHLLLNHVPVVGTLFALLLFAAAVPLPRTVSIRFALGFSAVDGWALPVSRARSC